MTLIFSLSSFHFELQQDVQWKFPVSPVLSGQQNSAFKRSVCIKGIL